MNNGLSIGLDVGSQTIKLVTIEDGRVTREEVRVHAHNPLREAERLLAGLPLTRVVATGYGRRLIERQWPCRVISEITAMVHGARFLFADCRGVVDIGGQDTKAVAIGTDGSVGKFEMNDKCAAGTGRFLEVMAMALGLGVEELATLAMATTERVEVSEMCTVFAESEMISQIAQGAAREPLARGLHYAVAKRAIGLARRAALQFPVVFCGGVAWNECMKGILAQELGGVILSPKNPQTVAALGCAWLAANETRPSPR